MPLITISIIIINDIIYESSRRCVQMRPIFVYSCRYFTKVGKVLIGVKENIHFIMIIIIIFVIIIIIKKIIIIAIAVFNIVVVVVT